MSTFETNPKVLKNLLMLIDSGELALPDFQRDFVWDPSAIEELIESIMKSYPAGSLLFLKHSGEGFQVRVFDGAPPLRSTMSTSYLVMDGQQRLTSLYQAFFGKGEHLFYLDIKELIETGDVEAAVWHESKKRAEKMSLNDLRIQAERLVCPLRVVMTDGFDKWIDDIIDLRPEKNEELKELKTSLRSVNKEWISPILEYQFPVVTLSSDTSLDAVCKMFETLNRRGVKLTVFELLMARSFMNKVSLRAMWDEAQNQNESLEQFGIDPYYILQIISLLAGKSLKRKEILEMSPDVILKHWEAATKALSEALLFIRRNLGVLSPNLLPYNTMLIPLAAAWSQTSSIKGPTEAVRRQKFRSWFLASVFSQAYEQGPTSRAVADYKDLCRWISGEDRPPFGVRVMHFNPDMFREISPKQRALYRGTLALTVASGAKDFHNAEPLTHDYLDSNRVDDHHIFPQDYLKKSDEAEMMNCVLNRTLIDRKTNIRISNKAPSRYLKEIENEVGTEKLKSILGSHLIPFSELSQNDFESFITQRSKMLFDELKRQMNQDIPLSPVVYAEESEGLEEEESDSINPKDKYDPSIVNVMPETLLNSLPSEISILFKNVIDALTRADSAIWWKVAQTRVTFWAPEKAFVTSRLSKNGIYFTTFTDGRELEHVTPIVQKNRGGELWGRIRLKNSKDLELVTKVLMESQKRIKTAINEGRATAWWAMTKKSLNN